MVAALTRFCKDERGHTAIEYGLIAVCVAVGIIVSVQTFGIEVEEMFSSAKDGFTPEN